MTALIRARPPAELTNSFWLEQTCCARRRGRERGSDFAPPAALHRADSGTLG